MIRDVYKLPDEVTFIVAFIVAFIVVGAKVANNDIQFISYLEEGESFKNR